ncbi:MAG: BPSL0067 family protein, partial [Kamptonema sp. SIO4C4]|nr:BPSL0067 family protein [Kamptonema sp. SIO4C4]
FWVIGATPKSGGYSIHRWTGSGWQQVGGGATRITVAPDGTPWLVNSVGKIYKRVGNNWQQMPGQAHDIEIGADGSIWVIGKNPVSGGYGIYKWKGNGWTEVGGGAVRITVAPDGTPWVVNGKVSSSNPAPSALKATSSYLNKLKSGQLNGHKIEADGAYWYQCVDLTKKATGTSHITTHHWKRGANVMQNKSVAVGSAIAIFNSSGSYNHRHTAIFAGYDKRNGVDGFWAWSQNFPTGSGVRKHFIPVNGSAAYNNDADQYHVILPL